MGDDDPPDHVEGVDFTDINPLLEHLSFPVTADELVDEHGDREVDRTNADPVSLSELFDYMGEDTFDSAEQLRQMVIGQMPAGSEGRRNYSDRGGSNPTTTEAAAEADERNSADLQDGVSTDPDTKQRDADSE